MATTLIEDRMSPVLSDRTSPKDLSSKFRQAANEDENIEMGCADDMVEIVSAEEDQPYPLHDMIEEVADSEDDDVARTLQEVDQAPTENEMPDNYVADSLLFTESRVSFQSSATKAQVFETSSEPDFNRVADEELVDERTDSASGDDANIDRDISDSDMIEGGDFEFDAPLPVDSLVENLDNEETTAEFSDNEEEEIVVLKKVIKPKRVVVVESIKVRNWSKVRILIRSLLYPRRAAG